MIPPIRVIMQDGTVHTYRNCGENIVTVLAKYSGWARIERTDIKQPQPLIEGDDDA